MIDRRKFLLGAIAVTAVFAPVVNAVANVSLGPMLFPPRHLTRHWRPNAWRNLIVYSRRTGERRRVVDPDDDMELALHVAALHPGEGHFFIAHTDYDAISNPHILNDLTAKHAGFDREPDPRDCRYAFVSAEGVVVNVVMADPACGDCAPPGHVLIHAPDADIGDVLIA